MSQPNAVLMEDDWKTDDNTKSNVHQSWKDDKRALKIFILQWIAILAIPGAYFIYLAKDYNDQSKNSVTTSALVQASAYDIPYMLIESLPYTENPNAETVVIKSRLTSNKIFFFNEKRHFQILIKF